MQSRHPKALAPPPRPAGGFTLIEILVVAAILAILIALAAPDLSRVVERNRVRQATEELTATLYFARTEAIKRGGLVKIQKLSCAAAPTNQEWSCGWTVFHDANDNDTRNTGDLLLRTSAAPASTFLMTYPARKTIAVDRWGNIGSTLGASRFVLTPKSGDLESTTTLCISAGGRLRQLAGDVECNS